MAEPGKFKISLRLIRTTAELKGAMCTPCSFKNRFDNFIADASYFCNSLHSQTDVDIIHTSSAYREILMFDGNIRVLWGITILNRVGLRNLA